MDVSEKPKRNWVKIALIGSLAVNLLIVGLIVGAVMRFDKGQGRHLNRVSMGLGLFIQALPDEARAEVNAAGGPHLGNRRAFRKEIRSRQKALEMLEAVQIRDPERVMNAYPHEVSGGMGQRAGLAVADGADGDLAGFAFVVFDGECDVTVEASGENLGEGLVGAKGFPVDFGELFSDPDAGSGAVGRAVGMNEGDVMGRAES